MGAGFGGSATTTGAGAVTPIAASHEAQSCAVNRSIPTTAAAALA
jgi:hypothetical protein